MIAEAVSRVLDMLGAEIVKIVGAFIAGILVTFGGQAFSRSIGRQREARSLVAESRPVIDRVLETLGHFDEARDQDEDAVEAYFRTRGDLVMSHHLENLEEAKRNGERLPISPRSRWNDVVDALRSAQAKHETLRNRVNLPDEDIQQDMEVYRRRVQDALEASHRALAEIRSYADSETQDVIDTLRRRIQ